MNIVYVSDFKLDDGVVGGSEFIDRTVVDLLGCEFQYSGDIEAFDPRNFYVISNLSRLKSLAILESLYRCRYIVIEHDYKFVIHRHPWRFKDCIVPPEQIINREFYKKSELTFVQSGYHLDVFRRNGIEGRFYNSQCGIWSKRETLALTEAALVRNVRSGAFAIVESDNWIKNTKGAVEFCKRQKLDYELIADKDWKLFLSKLSSYSGLVFFPLAGETLCRLVVEARCLGLNVITNPTYGATLEEWYEKKSHDLINYLSQRTKTTLKVMGNALGLAEL